MSELTPEQVTEIRSLRARRYTTEQVCKLMNCTEQQVTQAMVRNNTQEKCMTDDDMVDGERIADRIARITIGIKTGKLRIYRRNKTIIAEEIL